MNELCIRHPLAILFKGNKLHGKPGVSLRKVLALDLCVKVTFCWRQWALLFKIYIQDSNQLNTRTKKMQINRTFNMYRKANSSHFQKCMCAVAKHNKKVHLSKKLYPHLSKFKWTGCQMWYVCFQVPMTDKQKQKVRNAATVSHSSVCDIWHLTIRVL